MTYNISIYEAKSKRNLVALLSKTVILILDIDTMNLPAGPALYHLQNHIWQTTTKKKSRIYIM